MPVQTMREFSCESARSYLQTAVFVDDRIYEKGTGKVAPAKNLEAPVRRKPAVAGADPEPPPTPSIPSSDDADAKGGFSAQDIVVSFAEEGIVCGLYQPSPYESLDERSSACKLCMGADISIIDWDLAGGGTTGDRALDLIGALINRSTEDVPEQLRLVMIYTGEPSLTVILDHVFERLEKLLGTGVKPVKDASGDLALHTTNSRVIVRGKPGITRTDSGVAGNVIRESDLARETVSEYAKLASGLLQGSVLRALGAIRRNSRRILTRFDARLDPAYLTHRALSLPHDDASDHVLPLVMSEVQAVLEDRVPDNGKYSDEILSDWVETRWQAGKTLPEAIRNVPNAKEIVKKLIRDGASVGRTGENPWKDITERKKGRHEWTRDPKIPAVVGECVLGACPKATHEAFSSLMSMRTHYRSKRMLRLGTILSDPGDRFFICLQPECDCIRLDKARSFLFVELCKVHNPNDNTFNLIIQTANSITHRFRLSHKVFRSHVATFAPDPDSGAVQVDETAGKWEFKSEDGQRIYSWLGQLKPDHAQRAAQVFASELARVGVTESEWLRRMG